jgi:hypothetical protein
MPTAGFSPRKASLTFYIEGKFDSAQDLFARLGKHKKSRVCLYINKFEDVDLDVFYEIIAREYRTTMIQK